MAVEYRTLAESARDEVVAITRELVRVQSMPGHEGEIAGVLARRLEQLGYDRVWTDPAGNVLGSVSGSSKRRILLNGHMDHVDPGDPAAWPHPPFEAAVADGSVWGRGSADMKGALALQALAPVLLRRAGVTLPCEILYSAVVMEEVGGLGAREMLRSVHADVAIVGEGNANNLAIGHRGRVEVLVTAHGVGGHASAPERAVNPNMMLSNLVQRLADMPLGAAQGLRTSVAPTICRTEGDSTNVIPERATLVLDFRNAPGESAERILASLQPLLEASAIPGGRLTAVVPEQVRTTYTGVSGTLSAARDGFLLPMEHPVVVSAHRALEAALARPVKVAPWTYATDGVFMMEAGIPTIGFGPSDESAAHVPIEHVTVDRLVEGLAGIMALIMELGKG